MRDVWRRRRSLGTAALDNWALGPGEQRFWKPRGYDYNVCEKSKVVEKLEYMHNNPVRRELVQHPNDWRWSSYRFYEHGDESMIGMDWDGGFPILM